MVDVVNKIPTEEEQKIIEAIQQHYFGLYGTKPDINVKHSSNPLQKTNVYFSSYNKPMTFSSDFSFDKHIAYIVAELNERKIEESRFIGIVKRTSNSQTIIGDEAIRVQ